MRAVLAPALAPALVLALALALAGGTRGGHAAEPLALPELDCVVEPNAVVDVTSAVEGVLESIDVERSDFVVRGERIASLEAGVERATVDLAEARAGMDTEVNLHRASLDFERRRQGRTDALYRQKAVPFRLKDEADTDAAVSGWKLRQARDNQLLARLELRRARELLKLRTVYSPVDGVVVERFKAPGEFVEDKPIVRIAEIDPLRVEVIVPAAYFGAIDPGMRAEIIPEQPGDGVHTAEVTIVDRVIDAASGTFGVRLSLPNPGNRLPGGLKCSVRFLSRSAVHEEPPAIEGPGQVPDPLRAAPEERVPGIRSEPPLPEAPIRGKPVPGADVMPVAAPRRVPSSSPVCHSIGPFRSSPLAERASRALAERAGSVRRRVESADEVIGHIVLAPARTDGETNRQLVDRFRAAGVSDFAPMSAGPWASRISLGVYAGPQSAEARRAAIAKLGIAAEVQPRTSASRVVWLDVDWADAAPGPEELETVLAEWGTELDARERACASTLAARY